MVYKDSHLSDQDLLLAADGELPARRQSEVRRHLHACWTCRRRMAEMEGTIAEFVDCYHASLDPQVPPHNGPAALLKARLVTESSAPVKRGWIIWVEQIHRWRWPALAAFALFLVVATGTYLWRWRIQQITLPQTVSSLEAETIPNPSLTPGETLTASRSDVCQVNTLSGNREVSEPLKEAVFSRYGMKNAPRNAYEVDFLITPALGGSATVRNLWPEPYHSRSWNAHVKDVLEDRLHALVCSGDLDLSTAQHEIAANWVDAYKKYVRTDDPM